MTEINIQNHPTTTGSEIGAKQFHLRLWPAVLAVAVLVLARIWALTGEPAPFKFFFGLVITPAGVTIALLLWWLLASGLRWKERIIGLCVFLATSAATIAIAGKNFPPFGLMMYALPILSGLWVLWLVLSFALSWPIRRAGVYLIFIGCGVVCSLLRVDGMDGSFKATFNWRWTPTPEDKMLAHLTSPAKTSSSESLSDTELNVKEGDWPCFRGPHRDSRLTAVRILTNWEKSPPKELWRHRVGPGWSSCAVIGNRLFTQEQRGSDEFVVCYDTETGREVWNHHNTTRFEEIVAGAGPRSTPTFHDGRIYTLGATGRLNCLNASTGQHQWTADITKDSKAKTPQWGFSSSPLVSNGLVSVFAGDPDGKCILAYKIVNGELAWSAGKGSDESKELKSYSSPQLAKIDGQEQVLISTDLGLMALEPEGGTVLWEHRWPVEQPRCVQPAVLNETDLLLGTGMSDGTRRLHIQRENGEWKIAELWTTKLMKPYYNDLVVCGDNLYGFDGNVFMCVSLTNGKMKWRSRGYGNGQVLLLADQALLVISTETGEVALVDAQPDEHKELARFKAIEGKTWNHPVIAHGKLFVRNGEEMACFALDLESESPQESATNTAEEARDSEEPK